MERLFFWSKAIPTNKAKQTTTNTPAWSPPPDTGDIIGLRSQVGKVDFTTPLRNAYARANTEYKRTFNNPLGAYTTADVRDKSIREHGDQMNTQYGMDLASAAMANQQNAFGQQATLAGLTAPRFYNASSSTSQPFTGGDAVSLGASLGGALL